MIDPSLYACAPHIAPHTLREVIRVESSGNPIAVNVNVIRGRPRFRVPRIQSAAHAAQIANQAISQGYNVDLGLMQINSRNLPRLGYTVEQMLSDQCLNIKAGARILSENYSRAAQTHGPGQQALLAALSAYNTGDFRRGFTNGYVSRYTSINYGIYTRTAEASSPPSVDGPPVIEVPNPFTAGSSVYSRESNSNANSAAPSNIASPDPLN